MIREVVHDNRMPPWHADPKHGKFSNARRMTKAEIAKIDAWVAAGAPAGDLSKAPEAAEIRHEEMAPAAQAGSGCLHEQNQVAVYRSGGRLLQTQRQSSRRAVQTLCRRPRLQNRQMG